MPYTYNNDMLRYDTTKRLGNTALDHLDIVSMSCNWKIDAKKFLKIVESEFCFLVPLSPVLCLVDFYSKFFRATQITTAGSERQI